MKRSYSNQKKSDDVFIYMYNPSLEPTPMPNIENPMQSSINTTETNEEIDHLERTDGKY